MHLMWELVFKALAHKYLSKRKGKNGKWIYVYADGSRHGDHSVAGHKLDVKDEHIHEGASFSAGSGKGHYVVKSAKDGKVTFHHDEDGKEHTLSHDEFKKHVKGAHKEAAKKHATEGLQKRKDVLDRAEKHGTDAHKKRARQELHRWIKQHKDEHLSGEHKERNAAMKRMFAAASKDNISKEQLRTLLGVESIADHATAQEMSKLASQIEGKDEAVFSKIRAKTQDREGLLQRGAPLEEQLPAYMKAVTDMGKEADHAKAIALYKKIVQAQKDIKEAHGLEIILPQKPESPDEKKAREEADQKAEEEKKAEKERKEAEKTKRLEQIANSPDGWKEHLKDKGIDPEHPYLKEHAEKAQQLWDTWGVALQPPDRPMDGEKHNQLWEMVNSDLDQFMGAVDMQQMRQKVAKSGLTMALEESIPLEKEHAASVGFDSAAGIYRPSSKKLEVMMHGGAQHTLLHEFAHAMDHLSGEGKFLSRDKASALKKHLDALPEARLSSSLSAENVGYYKRDTERVARAMEQFLPALSMSQSSFDLGKRDGYYTKEQLRFHADTFAKIAREVGIPVKQEAIEHFRDEEKFRESMFIKQAIDLGEAPKHIANKEPGHEWASRARSYLMEGKHDHAIAALERAKREHGGKKDANPWHDAHELAIETHNPPAWALRVAQEEMAEEFPEAKKANKIKKEKLPRKTKEGLTIPDKPRTTGALSRKLDKKQLPAGGVA